MPYPAAGDGAVAGHPPHHGWPSWESPPDPSNGNAPSGEVPSSAWDSLAPERAAAGHPTRRGWPSWPDTNAPRGRDSYSAWEAADPLAPERASAGFPTRREWPSWPDTNAPRGRGSSSAWEAAGPLAPERSFVGHHPRRVWPSWINPPRGGDSSAWEAAYSLTQQRAAAGHPPRHECHWWPDAFDSNAPPGGVSDQGGELGPHSLADPFQPEPDYFDKVAGYFVEAARRLPMAQIPYLAHCIKMKGLAIGLADPVTNILLTTIDTFAHTEPYMIHPVDWEEVEQTKEKTTFANNARCSWVSMNRFIVCYFRHLTGPQADLLLHMSGYDLRVAIEAVQHYIDGGLFVSDSARTKISLEEASYPSCSAPELLRLMTSSYPCSLVEPVLEDLRQRGKLTADCIYKICQMLHRPCSPQSSGPPPPTPGTVRDSSGGFTIVNCVGGDCFATTRVSKDGDATATFTPARPAYASLPEDTADLLSMFPVRHERLVSQKDFCSMTLETPEFLSFLRFQLLDVIHGVYLKALALLPVRALRQGHLLHSLVTAGHCFGPLDPVSNIVINTVWYHSCFPLSADVISKLAAADILDARSMHRIESRSIDGLVAYLCRSHSRDEQGALSFLCKNLFSSPILELSNVCDVALAAKHPQSVAFGAFLERAPIRKLYEFYCLSRVQGNPDSAFERLQMAILQETSQTRPVERCAHHMDSSVALERSSFMHQQEQYRRIFEHLLIGYGFNDPLAPLYKLGVICGVTRQTNYSHTDVYHANFLASSDGGSSWEVFFAEFWNQQDERIEESKHPFCCPVLDNHGYPGRCVVCENDSSIILHPNTRRYYMGNSTLPFPAPGHLGDGITKKLDFDVIYSSP